MSAPGRKREMTPGEKSSWLLRLAGDGDAPRLRALLAAGAYCDPMSCSRETALMRAIKSGSAECAEILMEAGAAVNAKDSNGDTPLTLALELMPSAAQELLRRGARPDLPSPGAALFAAAQADEPRSFGWLLAAGADPRAVNESGEGVFHYLAMTRPRQGPRAALTLAMASAALAIGAPIDEPDRQGWTPLHLAAALGNAILGGWLLERGADDAARCGPKERSGLAYKGMEGLTVLEAARFAAEGMWGGAGSAELAVALAARQEARELARSVGEAQSAPRRVL